MKRQCADDYHRGDPVCIYSPGDECHGCTGRFASKDRDGYVTVRLPDGSKLIATHLEVERMPARAAERRLA